ncbi:unnamed protein product [Parajaminaea phylloscopi]
MGRKAEVQRIQLEKLMGPEAMGLTTEQLHFTDSKVCRNFLCGTCPHDLFSNTKVDLGPCPKSHTARLKDEFKATVTKGDKYPQFEAEYEDNIRIFMADIDRKIAANKRRIDQTPEETAKFTNLMHDISEIETAMNAAMAEVERLGEQGEVEASLQELAKAEALKQEKADRERDLQILSDSAGASGHQKLRVCDVCGAYLSILDSDRRLADHFGGRMHLGYLRLREIIAEFDERRAKGEDPRTLIAQGVGARPSGSSSMSNGNGRSTEAYHTSSSSSAMPAYPSSQYQQPPTSSSSMDYGGSGGLSYGDGERDAERDRRDRERRERRAGDYSRSDRDYRGHSPVDPRRSDRDRDRDRNRERERERERPRYDGEGSSTSRRRSRSPEDRSRRRDSATSGAFNGELRY